LEFSNRMAVLLVLSLKVVDITKQWRKFCSSGNSLRWQNQNHKQHIDTHQLEDWQWNLHNHLPVHPASPQQLASASPQSYRRCNDMSSLPSAPKTLTCSHHGQPYLMLRSPVQFHKSTSNWHYNMKISPLTLAMPTMYVQASRSTSPCNVIETSTTKFDSSAWIN